ncbi:hypothetical protein EDD37DRAFT_620750 [Exophiala viscosa]|uniref:Uncharacterized protein n=1 Tax=Exophiala viscosa TaxID=2486360 RepID=A0AAN6IHW3_9EURO|nr:hypothetical protein EDD36DRAFT_9940 [Exophiala viscosa]KAI1626845.1 hypothetical protein EDD37DRAFT_620750 [Exophiala viscosa]
MASVSSSVESMSRCSTPGSSISGESPMRSFGDSYFESVNTMTVEYLTKKKQSKSTATTPSVESPMRSFGDSYFENVNAMTVEYLTKKKQTKTASRPQLVKMNSYGSSWFDNQASQFEEWQKAKQARLA